MCAHTMHTPCTCVVHRAAASVFHHAHVTVACAWCVHGACIVCAWCVRGVCHLPGHIPCRRPQPGFRGRPPRRQFAALAYQLRSPWSAAPMAHESIEGERIPTEMCDYCQQKTRRIVGQNEQARTPGPCSGDWPGSASPFPAARWCPRRVLLVPEVELLRK